MMKRFVRPRPGARRTLPEITEEPSSPNALMCSLRMLARALFQAAECLASAWRIQVHRRLLCGAQVREELLVASPRLVHPAGRGDDDDIRVGAARDAHKALQNMTVVFLVFGAADRHDPAAALAVGNFTWHTAAPPRARFPLCRRLGARDNDCLRAVCRGNTALSAHSSPTIQRVRAGQWSRLTYIVYDLLRRQPQCNR